LHCGGVNEGDAYACAQAGITITEGMSSIGADQTWVCHDILKGEVTIVGLMKVNEDGHNLADA